MVLRSRDAELRDTGRWIRWRRQRAGWSQAQLAAAVRSTQSAVSKIESGAQQIDAVLLGELIRIFKVTPNQARREIEGRPWEEAK